MNNFPIPFTFINKQFQECKGSLKILFQFITDDIIHKSGNPPEN